MSRRIRSVPGGFERGARRALVAGVVLAGAAVYLGALNNPFVFDDHRLILENRSLASPGDLRAILWRDVTRPLINVTYAADFAFWGQTPFGFHLTNVLMHALNVWLVFCVAWRLALDRVRRDDAGRGLTGGLLSPMVVAGSTSLLFAVHPAMTQAVGYISGRSELACTAFLLMTFLAARRYMLEGGLRWAAAGLLTWAAALSSKEVAAILPFLLLAYERIVLLDDDAGQRRRLLWRVHVPMLSLTVLLAVVRVWVLLAIEYPDEPLVWTRALVAADAVRRYMILLFFPHDQTIFHALRPIDRLFGLRAAVAVGSLAAMGAAAWRVRRLDPLVSFGLLWFVLLLVPSSALFVLGRGEAFAEHRVYGASIGLFLVQGMAVAWAVLIARRWSAAARAVLWVGLALLALNLTARTLVRNAIWSSPVALWVESVRQAPDHWLPRLMLAEALRDERGCAAAEAQYRKGIDLRPQEEFGYRRLGACLLDLRRLDDAGVVFATMRTAAPRSPDGPIGLAMIAMMRQSPDESRRYLHEAIDRDPTTTVARQLLATLDSVPDPAEALRRCSEVRALDPGGRGIDACIGSHGPGASSANAP